MEPFKQHTGLVYPLKRANVDTDQIIPKQFLKRISRQGFGQYLFYNWRFDKKDKPREDFSLNHSKYEGTSVLVSLENFGSGSSREHAPWALEDYGFKAIIAPSFADIFFNNCTKNGLLPVVLTEAEVKQLIDNAESESYHLTVDLENLKVYDDKGFETSFTIDEYSRSMLLNGWDEIAVTLTHEDKITEFEKKHVVY